MNSISGSIPLPTPASLLGSLAISFTHLEDGGGGRGREQFESKCFD